MKSIALIWDLDGTLIDSYQSIISPLKEMCDEYGINLTYAEIYRECINTKAWTIIKRIASYAHITPEEIEQKHGELAKKYEDTISLMPCALDTLIALKELGVRNFVFTNRSFSAFRILKKMNILDFFIEVITSDDGFPRKPERNVSDYLVDKYQLDRNHTYYIGDRLLDIEFANKSEIGGIYYLSYERPLPTDKARYEITSLDELINLSKTLL